MSLRLGVVAPDFPPTLGGMQELSRELSCALAQFADVTVFTTEDGALPNTPFDLRPELTGHWADDRIRLGAVSVDAWIGLNAGVAPLAAPTDAPWVCYFVGNDFLDPWVGYQTGLAKVAHKAVSAVSLRRRIRRASIRRAVPNLHRVVTLSHDAADRVATLFPDAAGKVEVIPAGVGDIFFQNHSETRTDTLRVVSVCRLTEVARRKNIDGLLQALPRITPRTPIHLTVVGDGDDRARLEGLAASLGVTDSVTFAGRASDEELRRFYRESDLFALAVRASERDIEGFGIVYLEASAAGTPVLCSREGGAVDAVEDRVNGRILGSSSPEAIANAICEFADERDQYTETRVRSVAERHRWPLIAERLYGLVAHAVERRAA